MPVEFYSFHIVCVFIRGIDVSQSKNYIVESSSVQWSIEERSGAVSREL